VKNKNFLWSIVTMAKAKSDDEFVGAFETFDEKIEKVLFFLLFITGFALLTSVFIGNRGLIDAGFRIILGTFLVTSLFWRTKRKDL